MSSSNRKHEDVKEIDWPKTLMGLSSYFLAKAFAASFFAFILSCDEKEKV